MLLDTHVLLWLLADDPTLGDRARDTLGSSAAHVSAASMWEIAIKAGLGKLSVPDDLPDRIEAAGLAWLSVSSEHAWASRDVAGLPHRDPFDRLLVAQAAAENMLFLTADRVLLGSELGPTVRLQDARI